MKNNVAMRKKEIWINIASVVVQEAKWRGGEGHEMCMRQDEICHVGFDCVSPDP